MVENNRKAAEIPPASQQAALANGLPGPSASTSIVDVWTRLSTPSPWAHHRQMCV